MCVWWGPWKEKAPCTVASDCRWSGLGGQGSSLGAPQQLRQKPDSHWQWASEPEAEPESPEASPCARCGVRAAPPEKQATRNTV